MGASASLFLEDIDEIAPREELCVYGYTRRVIPNIPYDVANICLHYYHIFQDKWNKHCSNFDIMFSDDHILRVNSPPNYSNAFGTIIVKPGNIQSWKLKLKCAWATRRVQARSIYIGVINMNHISYNQTLNLKPLNRGNESQKILYENNAFYCHQLVDIINAAYGDHYDIRKGDVIHLTLDMTTVYNNHGFATIIYSYFDTKLKMNVVKHKRKINVDGNDEEKIQYCLLVTFTTGYYIRWQQIEIVNEM